MPGLDKAKLFSIRASEKKLQEYKAFFADKGLSVSKGVQVATDFLIDQARKKKIEVKDTGVYTITEGGKK